MGYRKSTDGRFFRFLIAGVIIMAGFFGNIFFDVMTSVVAILTLLPLALDIGQGSAMQQPLAIAIISGLLIQIPLVLVVLPALYHLRAFSRTTPPSSESSE